MIEDEIERDSHLYAGTSIGFLGMFVFYAYREDAAGAIICGLLLLVSLRLWACSRRAVIGARWFSREQMYRRMERQHR